MYFRCYFVHACIQNTVWGTYVHQYIRTHKLWFQSCLCYSYLVSYIHQDMVLMRALRDMNLPKFVFEDVPLFLGLIGDLFPGLDCPRVRYPKFNDAVEAILMENKYILLPNQVGADTKLIRIYLRVPYSCNVRTRTCSIIVYTFTCIC